MRPFIYERIDVLPTAMAVGQAIERSMNASAASQYLAGGTTLLDLMKLDVMRPEAVIDINNLQQTPLGVIDAGPRGLRLGALVRMSDAQEHPEVRRNYPMIAESLKLAASPQLRNMASLGGNVLQRTRCTYFRDVSYAACNKRNRGSGCAARDGYNRMHAVLGASDQCIATYPGDFAQALIALEALVEIDGPRGPRTLRFADLHRPPGSTPDVETVLAPGELITVFIIPSAPWTRRSVYLKVRDRQSYEFALASAAVALDLNGDGTVANARLALGGVATTPWRARDAEDSLRGNPVNTDTSKAAAEIAFRQAQPLQHNAFKIPLGKATLMRALQQAATMEI